jgi:hypothetical protein
MKDRLGLEVLLLFLHCLFEALKRVEDGAGM